MFTRILAAGALLAALPGAGQAATLYSNDFSANTTGFSGSTTLVTSPSGQRFIGNLTQNSTTTLTLNTANVVGDLTLTFNLYALLSLDGDAQFGGMDADGDNFIVGIGTAGGASRIVFNNTFANFPGNTQNFGGAGSQPQTGAADIGSLGYSFSGIPAGFADSAYNLTLSFAATGDTTVINFFAGSNQSIDDEFFGIDNVTVTGNVAPPPSGVPEPATWGMMILGFGLAGAAMRRKDKAVLA